MAKVALGAELAEEAPLATGELPGTSDGDEPDGVLPQLLDSAVNKRNARTPEQIATPRRTVDPLAVKIPRTAL